jgi:hypothetical protein
MLSVYEIRYEIRFSITNDNCVFTFQMYSGFCKIFGLLPSPIASNFSTFCI